MPEEEIRAIIWAAKQIAETSKENAAFLMGYAMGMQDAEKEMNRSRQDGGEGEQEQTH